MVHQFHFAKKKWFVYHRMVPRLILKFEKFDFLATVLVRGGGVNGKGGSVSDGSGIGKGLRVMVIVKTAAIGIGDRGGL